MPEVDALIALAQARFGEVNDAERRLLQSVARGEECVFQSHLGLTQEQRDAYLSRKDLPTIRAALLTWLMSDAEALRFLTHRGIRISGVRINGELDISSVKFLYDFGLIFCCIPGKISARNAQLGSLNLGASKTASIFADRINISGDALFDNNIFVNGGLSLRGATINGKVRCSSGLFVAPNKKDPAINASRTTIAKSMLMNNDFCAQGEVRIIGTRIHGNLTCTGGSFISIDDEGNALIATRATVDGSVYLSKGFNSQGKVKLLGTIIKGQLNCSKGSFFNKDGDAINACRMQVGESVFLNKGFDAHGKVQLLGASIAGNLKLSDCLLSNKKGAALDIRGLTVRDSIKLLKGFSINGKILFSGCTVKGPLIMRDWNPKTLATASLDLRMAKVQTLMDEKTAWPHKGNLHLDGFTYESIAEGSPISAEERLDWLDRQDDTRFRSQPYEQLAEVLRRYGQEQDARDILYEKNNKLLWFLTHGSLKKRQKWYRKTLRSSPIQSIAGYYSKMLDTDDKTTVHDYTSDTISGTIRIWLSRLLKFSIGFGYRTWWAFLWFAGLVLLGTAVFDSAKLHELMTPAQQYVQTNNIPEHLPRTDEWMQQHQADTSLTTITANDYPDFSPLIYALDTFIPLVDLGQEDYWIPNVHASSFVRICNYDLFQVTGRTVRWFMVGYIILGWILTSLIVASLTGLLKK